MTASVARRPRPQQPARPRLLQELPNLGGGLLFVVVELAIDAVQALFSRRDQCIRLLSLVGGSPVDSWPMALTSEGAFDATCGLCSPASVLRSGFFMVPLAQGLAGAAGIVTTGGGDSSARARA